MRSYVALQFYMVFADTIAQLARPVDGLESENRVASHFSFPDIVTQLGPQLSQNAAVLVSSSSGFDNAAQRWQTYNDPSFSAIVDVAVESDIVKTVRLKYTSTGQWLMPMACRCPTQTTIASPFWLSMARMEQSTR